MRERTLILLNVSTVALCDAAAGEVTAQDHNLGYKVTLYTIVEYSGQSFHAVRMIQPYVRKEEEIDSSEIFSDSCRILRLVSKGVESASTLCIHRFQIYILEGRRGAFPKKVDMPVY